MRIFALETSTERLSLALLKDGQMFERDIDAGQRHSDLALPLIRALFDEARIAIADLDAIAFGQGPGSFTGVRIACGLAQGMAFGAGICTIPVETQMTLAEVSGKNRVLVALDARMGEIYLAAYVRDEKIPAGWAHEVAPMLARPRALPALQGDGWHLTGSAAGQPALLEALQRAYAGQIAETDDVRMPRARAAALIAGRILARTGEAAMVPPRDAAPLYLRDRVALTTAEREAAKRGPAAVAEVAA
ncbi:MAG: tRNA (adenosine(37)-N6)-threonylcarbamoyltransferase complex dimerization subunit type 1 TsaB [Betaproteobacteria bacterium]|nr:tRNA (adenosine(37)-N6)-threonylcarbamoyltransferase complex dimerization subunit type 1 TsaB [Betaproteobacteria bacterium]